MADHESMNGLHESHDLFKREHDEQLVQWMNRRPDDWTLSAGGSGTIYGWGHNHRGQLGGIEGAKVKVPTPTEALATLRPVQLIGGEQTLFAVTADGKVATQRSYISNKGVDQKCFSCDFEHCLVFCSPPRHSALCHWVRSWRPTGHWRNGVCIHPDSAGVHPARLHQESGSKFWREALPGAVLRGGGVLVGGGGGWKARPREQKVRSQSNKHTPHSVFFNGPILCQIPPLERFYSSNQVCKVRAGIPNYDIEPYKGR